MDSTYFIKIIIQARDEFSKTLSKVTATARAEIAKLKAEARGLGGAYDKADGSQTNFTRGLRNASDAAKQEVERFRSVRNELSITANAFRATDSDTKRYDSTTNRLTKTIFSFGAAARGAARSLFDTQRGVRDMDFATRKAERGLFNLGYNAARAGDNFVKSFTRMNTIAALLAPLIFTLITALLNLAAALVSVASAAAIAAAALGGALVAGIMQAIPVVGLLAAAMHRLGLVTKAATLIDKAHVKGVAVQKKTEEELADARRKNARDLIDIQNAKVDAILAEQSASLSLLEARQRLADLDKDSLDGKREVSALEGALAEAQQNLAVAKQKGDTNAIAEAQNQVASAQQQLNTAKGALTTQTTELERRRAQLTVKEAEQRKVEAEINKKRAIEDAARAKARGYVTKPAEAKAATADTKTPAQQALAALDPVEKHLLGTIQRFKKLWREATRPLTDAILEAIDRALVRFSTLLRDKKFIGAFKILADAIAGSIDQLSKFFTSKEQREFFEKFAKLAASNLPLIVKIFENLVRLAERIGIAFAPVLKSILKGTGSFLGDQAAKADEPAKAPKGFEQNRLGAFAAKAGTYLDSIAHFFGALFNFLGALITVAAGPGKSALDKMTDSFNKWAKELETTKKKGAQEFFTNALRATGILFDFFGKLLALFFKISSSKEFEKFLETLIDVGLPVLTNIATVYGALFSAIATAAGNPFLGKLIELFATVYGISKLTPIGALVSGAVHSLLIFALNRWSTAIDLNTRALIGTSLTGGGGGGFIGRIKRALGLGGAAAEAGTAGSFGRTAAGGVTGVTAARAFGYGGGAPRIGPIGSFGKTAAGGFSGLEALAGEAAGPGGGLARLVATGPILAGIIVISGAVRALTTNFLGLRDIIVKIFTGRLIEPIKKLGESFKKLADALTGGRTGKILHEVGEAFKLLGKYLGPVLDLLLKIVGGAALVGFILVLGLVVAPIYAIIKGLTFLVDAITWIVEHAASWGEAIADGLIGGFKTVADFFSDIGHWLYQHIVKPILNFFGITSPSKLMASIGKDLALGLYHGFINAVASLFRGIGGFLNQHIIQPITGWVTGAVGKLADIGVSIARAIVSGIGRIGTFVGGVFNRLPGLLLEGLRTIKDKFADLGGKIWGWIKDGIKDGATSFFKKLAERVPGVKQGEAVVKGIAGLFRRQGGEIDSSGESSRLPITRWLGAPRFDQGGQVQGPGDAVPIIAHVGEWVVNDGQQRKLSRALAKPIGAIKDFLFGTGQMGSGTYYKTGGPVGTAPASEPERRRELLKLINDSASGRTTVSEIALVLNRLKPNEKERSWIDHYRAPATAFSNSPRAEPITGTARKDTERELEKRRAEIISNAAVRALSKDIARSTGRGAAPNIFAPAQNAIVALALRVWTGNKAQIIYETKRNIANALTTQHGVNFDLAKWFASAQIARHPHGRGPIKGYDTGGAVEGSSHGAAVPIVAHVGEWVLNKKQQMKLSTVLGKPVGLIRDLLFGKQEGQTKEEHQKRRKQAKRAMAKVPGLQSGVDEYGNAFYGFSPGIDDWSGTDVGTTTNPNKSPIFIETPLGQYVNLARQDLKKVIQGKGFWLPNYVTKAHGFATAGRTRIEKWKRGHVVRGLGGMMASSVDGGIGKYENIGLNKTVNNIMKSPLWSYARGGVVGRSPAVGWNPARVSAPSFAAGGVVTVPATTGGNDKAAVGATQKFEVHTTAPDIDIAYIMRLAKIHSESGT